MVCVGEHGVDSLGRLSRIFGVLLGFLLLLLLCSGKYNLLIFCVYISQNYNHGASCELMCELHLEQNESICVRIIYFESISEISS